MLSRDSEEESEDDDIEEGLGIAPPEGSGRGESCSEVTTAATKEEGKGAEEGLKGAEQGLKGAEGFEHKGRQSPTKPKQDIQRLGDNVT